LYLFFAISIRPIISTSTGPIFAKFAGLVELPLQTNKLVFYFDFSNNVALLGSQFMLAFCAELRFGDISRTSFSIREK